MATGIIPGLDRVVRVAASHLRSPEFTGLRIEVVDLTGVATRFRLWPPKFAGPAVGGRFRLVPLDSAGRPERSGLRRPDLSQAEALIVQTLAAAAGGSVWSATQTQAFHASLSLEEGVNLSFVPREDAVLRI